ncbi:phage terminase large subunit [Tautonia sp. JC769]|uniref:phage terminase large subunit n=1 Tax=Tautonia sp. JC769 TaxID=3232135 RepID=UPI00345AF411
MLALAEARLRELQLRQAESPAARTYRGDLAAFARAAWPVLEPGTPLEWNWHHEAICRHLEAVVRGHIRNLIINVPPGSAKSTLACVMLPAWVWTWWPGWRSMFATYGERLAGRDSVKCRRLVRSEWYQETFAPDWSFLPDQNVKLYYENTSSGFRLATTVAGEGTGLRGHCTIIDDPHNVRKAFSDAEVENATTWHDQTWWNRQADMRAPGRIVIMQRLRDVDLTGHLIGSGRSEDDHAAAPLAHWEHLNLPAEYDPERACVTYLTDPETGERTEFFRDPRTEEGELLDPVRQGEAVLAAEKLKGEAYYACQYQQDTRIKGGDFFQVTRLRYLGAVPAGRMRRVRYWDTAGSTEEGSAFTVGARLSIDDTGRIYVEHVIRKRVAKGDREALMRRVAETDPEGTVIWVEKQGGSAGMEAAQDEVRWLHGFDARIDQVSHAGNKIVRAGPLAAQLNAGNVTIVDDGTWDVVAFVGELEKFPRGRYKDQVDATSGAYLKLVGTPRRGRPVGGGTRAA